MRRLIWGPCGTTEWKLLGGKDPKRGMLQKEDNVLSFREITERRENIGVDRTGLVWSRE